VFWLFGVVWEFIEAVANGDRSWWPFLTGVAVLSVAAIALAVLT
jgi:hypothetical protein